MYTRPDTLCEEDVYRITPGDERTRRELIYYLQRIKHYEDSLIQIHKAKEESIIEANSNRDQKVATIYMKLEGMAHLQLGHEAESSKLLQQYVESLLYQEVRSLILFSPKALS